MFGRDKTPAPRQAVPAGSRQHVHTAGGGHGGGASWSLYIKAADARVPADVVARSPMLLQLAVEDLCWQAATESWAARRPRPWRAGERTRWREEGDRLREKAHRVAVATAELLHD